MSIISVIIPTYGNPKNLKRALNSVINQTFTDWELFVVDDNNPGTDERKKTEEIMSEYLQDCRIHYLKHTENKNGSAARNTGIANATGEYISFLDDDDEYINTRFERCLHYLKNNDSPDVAGIYTGCIFYRDGKLYAKKNKAKTGCFFKETLAVRFNSYSGSNLFIKKTVINELEGFDESFIRHQDYEFLVRVFRKYRLVGLPELLLVKDETYRNLPNITKVENVKKQYLDKFVSDIKGLKSSEQDYIYYSHWIELAFMAQSQKDERFSEYLKKATSYRPLTLKDFIKILLKR